MFMSAIYMGAWDYTTSDRKLELIDFIGCFYNNMNNFSCLIQFVEFTFKNSLENQYNQSGFTNQKSEGGSLST